MWKTVHGHPSYEVSDDGRVRVKATKRELVQSKLGGKLKPGSTSKVYASGGYMAVCLLTAEAPKGLRRRVHRLMLEAFIEPAPKGHQASHINGDRFDNRLKNLRWETPRENCQRRIAHGTQQCGEKVWHLAKMTAEAVLEMRARHAAGETNVTALGREYGIGQNAARLIILRQTWKHV